MGGAEQPLRLRDGELEWRFLDEETVVLDLRGSRYLALNQTGTLLWPMLAAGATRARLVEALMNEWELETAQAERDVDTFCARLVTEGLLER